MVHESISLDWVMFPGSGPQSHVQRVFHEVNVFGCGDAESDDSLSIYINDQRHVHKPFLSAHIREISGPSLMRASGPEVPVHKVHKDQAASLAAVTVSVIAATSTPGDNTAFVILGARISALAFIGAAIALALTRERHLFRYFKEH